MSKLFILGNGFDLSLGLRTSYKDFLDSSFFGGFVAASTKSRAPNLGDYLKAIIGVQRWADIEVVLADYSKNGGDGNFLSDYKRLCVSLREYLLVQQRDEINLRSAAYKLFSESYKYGDSFDVLTFNYTNSAERVLTEFDKNILSSTKLEFNVSYVHGSLYENNIIFGVDDGHEINPNHSSIRKTTAPSFSGDKVREKLFSGVYEELYFFGMSLGEADHMYFKEYFSEHLCKKNVGKKHIFFVYKEEGWDDLHKQFYSLTDGKVHSLKTHNPLKIIKLS